MTYRVEFPSGKKIVIGGELHAGHLGQSRLLIPGVVRPNGQVVLFDPRVVIYDDASVAVFTGCTTTELVDDTPT